MAKKIFRAICLAAALALVCSVAILTGVLYDFLENQTVRILKNDAGYLAAALEQDGTAYLERLRGQENRITLIAGDGTVLYDNAADSASMENHLDREEVQAALQTGTGTSRRRSLTLTEETIYVALRLDNGQILRVSASQRSVWALLLSVLQPTAVLVLLLLVLAAVLASRVSRRILAPINQLDLEHPENNEGYEELAPLLTNMARLHRTIDRQLEEARQKQEEFRVITDHMSEGILVIDTGTNLLSCNGAALRLLGAEKLPDNPSVLALNRSEAFRTAVSESLAGKRAETVLETGGKTVQIMANPVRQDDRTAGAVLLMVDVTERAQREALRREFSANVSHELKTPLTSISGFAELLKSGAVASQDVPDFARSIYDEAQRLIHMVEDIIKISSLDEADTPRDLEPVDLYQLALQETRRLRPAAEKNQVTLSVLGGAAALRGNERILREILYNLCDNAIQYNRPGGTVDVIVTAGDTVKLIVRDTGIGIPEASRNRVFERFYRVDKSRSRDVAGTGLGLSIVKHGARFHNAVLTLESEEGKGTTVTVEFPRENTTPLPSAGQLTIEN